MNRRHRSAAPYPFATALIGGIAAATSAIMASAFLLGAWALHGSAHDDGALIQWGVLFLVLVAGGLGAAAVLLLVIRRIMLDPLLRRLRESETESRAYRHAADVARMAAAALSSGYGQLSTLVAANTVLLNPMRTDASKATDNRFGAQSQPQTPEITWDLLGRPNRPLARRQLVDLNQVVDDVTRHLRQLLNSKTRIETDLGTNLPRVEGDPGQLHQVLLSLALNAGEAMPNGGKLLLVTRCLTLPIDNAENLPAGRYVEIAVSDDGVGIPDDVVKSIFDPFFTTKATSGSGLGLAMVRTIVENHGGQVDLFTQEEEGTTFTLLLPISDTDLLLPPLPAAKHEASKISRGSETILVIDGEEAVREALAMALSKAGYEILTTETPRQALELFRVRHREIDLVILDLSLPAGSGRRMFQELRRVDPKARVVFSTGSGDVDIPEEIVGPAGLLRKPYLIGEMAAAIRKVLDHG